MIIDYSTEKLTSQEAKNLRKLLLSSDFFNQLDFELYAFLLEEEKIENKTFLVTCILLNYLNQKGYICLDLLQWNNLLKEGNWERNSFPINLPEFNFWINQLRLFKEQVAFIPQGSPPPPHSTAKTLLILEGNRIYFQKNHCYENQILKTIKEKINQFSHLKVDVHSFKNSTQLLNEEQTLAVYSTLVNPLSIISGGPGTGKTFLIHNILYQNLKRNPEANHILLLAPTGKAVNRLKEALLKNIAANPPDLINGEINNLLKKAATIHRFIKESNFRGNNFVPKLDLVLIDEFSMVSFSLFYHLFQNLECEKIVFIGDHHQLSSISNGALLKDLVSNSKKYNSTKKFTAPLSTLLPHKKIIAEAGLKEKRLRDCIVELKKNYRQADQPDLIKIFQYVRDDEKNSNFLAEIKRPSDCFLWIAEYEADDYTKIVRQKMLPHYHKWFSLMKTISPTHDKEWTSHLKSKIILSPFKQGLYSTSYNNALIEKILREEKLISQSDYEEGVYHGKPIIITKNNYELGIFNGDLGVILEDEEGNYSLLLESLNHALPLEKVIHFETFYSLTIHKSQGSEFEEGILVFPSKEKSENLILNRELLYTALTRIKKKITLMIKEQDLNWLLENTDHRYSGLNERVWEL